MVGGSTLPTISCRVGAPNLESYATGPCYASVASKSRRGTFGRVSSHFWERKYPAKSFPHNPDTVAARKQEFESVHQLGSMGQKERRPPWSCGMRLPMAACMPYVVVARRYLDLQSIQMWADRSLISRGTAHEPCSKLLGK